MYVWFLSRRYLHKRRLAFFGIGAVVGCVALLIVVTSLFTGFIASYINHSKRLWGDVVVVPGAALTDREYHTMADALEACPEVELAMPLAKTGGLAYLGPGRVRAVQLVGVDMERKCRDAAFRSGLLRQGAGEAIPNMTLSPEAQAAAKQALSKGGRTVREEDMPVGAVLSIGLLAQPDDLTDEYPREALREQLAHWEQPVIITTGRRPQGDSRENSPSSLRQRLICWPTDIVETGLHDADTHFMYVPFSAVCALAGSAESGQEPRCEALLQITLAKGVSAPNGVEIIRKAWGHAARSRGIAAPVGVYAADEVQSVKQFTGEIRKQLFIWQIMLGMICLVAAFLVFVTLYMIVMQKRRDIGIIRSVGGSRWGVARVFWAYGLCIGVAGALGGLVLGTLATRHINMVESALTRLLGFKIWKSGVYMFKQIPNDVAWDAVGWICLAGVAAAILGATVPAIRAARWRPIEALRYE
ncbi:MAG: ABC transporter permease [Sedimentisphaerales bacterium]|nr:ABC transporter permease [Sedimentisphaerales bacterium]